MQALEGYFENLAVAAVNEELVIENLVANNIKLAASNKTLVAMVKIEQRHQEPRTGNLPLQEGWTKQPGSDLMTPLQEGRISCA